MHMMCALGAHLVIGCRPECENKPVNYPKGRLLKLWIPMLGEAGWRGPLPSFL